MATATGLAIGLVCFVGSSSLIRSLLCGVQAWDVVTLSLVACYWLSRRWRRASSLRVEQHRWIR